MKQTAFFLIQKLKTRSNFTLIKLKSKFKFKEFLKKSKHLF